MTLFSILSRAGSGGPDTPRIESKKHLPPPPDAMEGGEVGLTTDSQAPFVPASRWSPRSPRTTAT